MPKHLMIVESPAKAKTIEKYLGSDFTVRASYGHVRDLPKDDSAIDIENGFLPKYEVSADKHQVINELKRLVKDVDVVWLATDEDREGEAISWHLAAALSLNVETTNRVVFNEITKTAVTKAVANPRRINIDLVNAQQARRVLDRLVGFKLSPVLWRKIKGGLSAGRVQSVAVRLIVEREREINQFNATSTYKITAEFITEKGEVFRAELQKKIAKKEDALAFLQNCINTQYKVAKIEKKAGKQSPSAPFTTSTLQQEASRKLSFPVAITMRVAQSLYESGKITYMRTDSVNLSDTALQQAEDFITQNYDPNYHQLRKYKTKNASAQEAHEAIRPTDLNLSQIDGTNDEKRLYDLIWKRTVASQMADAQIDRTVVDVQVASTSDIFRAVGEVITFDGFLKVYQESSDDEEEEDGKAKLPLMQEGQALSLKEMKALERYSRPNSRYTEASLVKKLEELGIGRPSTYAATIKTVQDRAYVEKAEKKGVERSLGQLILKEGKITESVKTEITGAEKNKLFPTDLGNVVTDFLSKHFEQIMDYSFTAQVEQEFDEIAEGKVQWQKMVGDFYKDFATKVDETQEQAERGASDRILGTDPVSGKPVSARLGRYGAMIQIGTAQDEEKPRYAGLRSDQRLETITLEEALALFQLPRTLGEYEGSVVKAAIGRFGPYVQVGSVFVSLKDDSPYEIELARAIELYEEKKAADSAKVLKHFNDEVQVLNGRWGPYIKMGKDNVKIPKGTDIAALTLEDCEKLRAAGAETKKKPAAKK